MMQGKENDSRGVEIRDISWISVDVNGNTISADPLSTCSENLFEPGALASDFPNAAVQAGVARLFALAERSRAPLPERYPRLTVAAISLLLLLTALTAEFEYLRVAGYSWH